jgi:hypothetical protein
MGALFLLLIILAGIIAIPIVLVFFLISRDSSEYDLRVVWDGKYTREQLEL